ncbi:MAG: type II toxin-antitoxin system VapC family toxin [Archaeoglobaceae archaeon]
MNGVFVDSSVFLKVLEGNEKAKKLFKSLIRKERLYRNAIVYSEVLYVFIKLKTGKKSYEIRSQPEIIKSSEKELQKLFEFLNLAHSLPITEEVEMISASLMKEYGLLPNDALIAATCKHYGIRKIATFDEDFKKVDFLEVLEL